MIASEEKKVERRDQNCGSLNVWGAADKDLSFEHHQLQGDVLHLE